MGTRLNVFLTLKNSQGPAMRIQVASLEVLGEGVWLPISRGERTLDSSLIGEGQSFLGGDVVPPGVYDRLRITISKGEIKSIQGDYEIASSQPFQLEIKIADGISLEREESRCILVTWDLENSFSPGKGLQPDFFARPPIRELPGDLVYVSCPSIDTVFVVRADKNWVVDSFGIKGAPTYLSIDPVVSRGRLYVLTSREKMIKVVDLASYRVIDFFQVPLNDWPTYMAIHPDGRGDYLLDLVDERSGFLTRMDLFSGQTIARRFLDYRPQYLDYIDEIDQLAVTLSLSQKLVLLDPVSLLPRRTFSIGYLPQGLAVAESQLYVAESADNTVSVIDLISGIQNRVSVGFGPRRVLVADDQIYVSNFLDGSLSILNPGQFNVNQEISGLHQPQQMAYNKFYRRIYVAGWKKSALSVIDANINQQMTQIELGATPFGLAVTQ